MTLVLLATLAVAVVAFVLYPVFAPTSLSAESMSPDEATRERKRLAERKDRLYESIQDLDFEKAAGKLSDEDYEHARNDYLTQVSKTMARLDELAPPKKEAAGGRKKGKKKAPSSREGDSPARERTCGSCGEVNVEGARFCASCGEPLGASCASCGERLPDRARFCPACGKKAAS